MSTYEDGARVRRVGQPLMTGSVTKTIFTSKIHREVVYVAWDDRTGTFGMDLNQIAPELTEAEKEAYLQAKLSEATEGAVSPLPGALNVTGAIVGDLQRDMQDREKVQVEALAQAMHQAEKATTSFTHNLGYHRDIARKIFEKGARFVETYWRVDESYVNEHGRRVHNRWPMRYRSEAQAQRDIDRGEHWSSYDPAIHTELKMEVHRER